MWIKICGNMTLEDARFAAECGANAVGFVFAPSPRRVEADQVRKITEQLPAQLEKYGVFVDAGFDEIVSTVTASGLTGVQLHRTSDPLLPSRLRRHFAGRVGVLPVLHRQDEDFEQQLSRAEDTVLVDSSDGTSRGRHRHQLQLARRAEQLSSRSTPSAADRGGRSCAGKREAGNSDPAALGGRRGQRSRERTG